MHSQAAAVQYGMPYLFGHLSMTTIITIVTALLMERRLVVQCADMAILTGICVYVCVYIYIYIYVYVYNACIYACIHTRL